jgi:hypothetical protein
VDGQKVGGNVASYFCTADGRVLHAVAGPADAATLLAEARWVAEAHKLALLEAGPDDPAYADFFGKAHAERLTQEHRFSAATLRRLHGRPKAARPLDPTPANLLRVLGRGMGLNKQGQVHLLLTAAPLVKIEQVYKVVFENVLGETVSTSPVKLR